MGKTKFADCKRKFYLKKQSVYPNYIKYMSTYRKCVLFLLGFINGSQERGSTRELCVQVIRHDTRLALTQPERRSSSSSINFFIEPSRPRGRPRQSGLLFRWLPPLSQSRVFVVVVKHFISIRLKVTKKKQHQHNTGDNKRHGALLLFYCLQSLSFLCCVHVWQHHLASLSSNIYSARSRLCITHVIYYTSDNDFLIYFPRLEEKSHFQLTVRVTLTDAVFSTLGSI